MFVHFFSPYGHRAYVHDGDSMQINGNRRWVRKDYVRLYDGCGAHFNVVSNYSRTFESRQPPSSIQCNPESVRASPYRLFIQATLAGSRRTNNNFRHLPPQRVVVGRSYHDRNYRGGTDSLSTRHNSLNVLGYRSVSMGRILFTSDEPLVGQLDRVHTQMHFIILYHLHRNRDGAAHHLQF